MKSMSNTGQDNSFFNSRVIKKEDMEYAVQEGGAKADTKRKRKQKQKTAL